MLIMFHLMEGVFSSITGVVFKNTSLEKIDLVNTPVGKHKVVYTLGICCLDGYDF